MFLNSPYKEISEQLARFCECNNSYYEDIVAVIETGIDSNLMETCYVYHTCESDLTFTPSWDWYEGGSYRLIDCDYFKNVCKGYFERGKSHDC